MASPRRDIRVAEQPQRLSSEWGARSPWALKSFHRLHESAKGSRETMRHILGWSFTEEEFAPGENANSNLYGEGVKLA